MFTIVTLNWSCDCYFVAAFEWNLKLIVAQCLVALQMGLGMDIDSMVYGDFENDAELEAELRALQGEDSGGHRGQRQDGFGVVRGLYCTDLYCLHDIAYIHTYMYETF